MRDLPWLLEESEKTRSPQMPWVFHETIAKLLVLMRGKFRRGRREVWKFRKNMYWGSWRNPSGKLVERTERRRSRIPGEGRGKNARGQSNSTGVGQGDQRSRTQGKWHRQDSHLVKGGHGSCQMENTQLGKQLRDLHTLIRSGEGGRTGRKLRAGDQITRVNQAWTEGKGGGSQKDNRGPAKRAGREGQTGEGELDRGMHTGSAGCNT